MQNSNHVIKLREGNASHSGYQNGEKTESRNPPCPRRRAGKRHKSLASAARISGYAVVIILLVSVICGCWNSAPGPSAADQPVYAAAQAGEGSGNEDTPEEVPAAPADVDSTPWNLTLVNRDHPIPEGYEVELADVPGGEKVDARIYEPLMEMLDAAASKDLGPIVVSGFRTSEKQQRLYDEKIEAYQMQGYTEAESVELAEQWVAKPGSSEHQLGLAVDINGATYDIYLWLQENSYKYGFIFRYSGHKADITGVAEEVWHYRYVGTKAALEMYEQGICLEEYVEGLPAQMPEEPAQDADVWCRDGDVWRKT